MKLAGILIIALVALTGTQLGVSPQVNGEASHQQWLRERFQEAVSIKAGMNRADLLKLFAVEGGLNSIPPGRYVLRSCSLIHLDVTFDTPGGVNYQPVPDQDLKIKEVSHPYLQRPYLD